MDDYKLSCVIYLQEKIKCMNRMLLHILKNSKLSVHYSNSNSVGNINQPFDLNEKACFPRLINMHPLQLHILNHNHNHA